MSLKYSNTTADYIEWYSMLNLVRKLFSDGEIMMSLLIASGCFFGLRISDLRTLRWNMLLEEDSFTIIEKKTGKSRIIKINKSFQQHVRDCYEALQISDKNQFCFLSRKGTVMTTQRINVRLKEIKTRYHLKVKNLSTHSLRKTFGRQVVEKAGQNSEMALIKLSEIFNHSNIQVTRRYLGLRQQELNAVYDSLEF